MTDRVEQWICIQFCVKLQRSSTETIGMIQKAAATGNWWFGSFCSYNTPAHISHLMQVLAKHQITQVTQTPYSSDLAPCNFWLFPKLKSSLKGKRFQIINEIQENTTGQLMEIGRTVWGPKVPTLKGTEASLSHVHTMFLISCIFFNKCFYFSYYMAGYLLDRPHIYPFV